MVWNTKSRIFVNDILSPLLKHLFRKCLSIRTDDCISLWIFEHTLIEEAEHHFFELFEVLGGYFLSPRFILFERSECEMSSASFIDHLRSCFESNALYTR